MDLLRDILRLNRFLLALGFLLVATGCTRTLDQCGGPTLNLAQIENLRKTLFTGGPTAALVVPNPIDATGNAMETATDSRLGLFDLGFILPDLLSSTRLESSLVKVRIAAITDALSTLATPSSSGSFAFAISDVHYSETMAYHGVTSIMKYVEALGFSYDQTRPLYVLAQTTQAGESASFVNAYFQNNTLDPSQPRIMRMIGNSAFAPGQDRDMYWHESGHFANESVSHEIGIDRAGEEGAFYTDGAAIHECMADIIAESLANKGYIGKWINRNFKSDGTPLRSAIDTGSELQYSQVATQDNTGTYPERYKVAEWCTRALWQIRQQFVKEDPNAGSVFSDRLFLSAVSILPKDASLTQFHDALVTADQQLHCGLHADSIDDAFTSRGFELNPSQLSSGMTIQYQAVGEDASGNQATLAAGGTVSFTLQIANPNPGIAHNVRVILESETANFQVTTYMQGYGDLPQGKTAIVGNSGLPLSFSVSGQLDSTAAVGAGQVRYRLRVLSDNAPEVDKEGTL